MISYLSGAIYLFVSFVDGALSDEVVGVVNTGTDGAVHKITSKSFMEDLSIKEYYY